MAIRTRDPRAVASGNLAAGADVEVWTIGIPGPDATLATALTLLSREELARVDAFRNEQARRNYIFAHAALRQILGTHLNAPPAEIVFRTGPHGKPELAGAHGGRLHFNLSHSADLALIAVTRDAEAGIDVEKLRPMPDAQRIAERFFSPPESAALKQLSESEQAAVFFNLWTRKEALAKATGLGIAHSLTRFEVTWDGEAAVKAIDGDARQANRWSLRAFNPASGYIAAVAVNSGAARFSFREFQANA